MISLLIFTLLSCDEQLYTFDCFCEEQGFDEEGVQVYEQTTHETICETDANMAKAFNPGGVLYKALNECRDRLQDDYFDSSCECDCEYLEPCE